MDIFCIFQYQYMPFLLATLALLYYLPYMAFKSVNHDIVKLQWKIKLRASGVDVFKLFFKKRDRLLLFDTQISSRHIQIVLVKLFYIAVNVAVLYLLDLLLQGSYVRFGPRWIEWYKESNRERFNYMGSRENPKPGKN